MNLAGIKGWTLALTIIFAVIGISLLIHIVSALTVDRRIAYKETVYESPKINSEVDGYVIAFVTDTHSLPAEELKAVADKISSRGVDVLLLGGDFGGGVDYAVDILGSVKTADGIYGVDGNHDNSQKLFSLMTKNGITPLDNSGVRLRDGLYLAGVQDLWNRTPDAKAAVRDARDGDFIVMLSHNPDYSMTADASVADIMLSGHTHGGHVTLFGLWAPALTINKSITSYGQRFMSGFSEGNGVDVYVSRGTGKVKNAPRVFSPPEVTFITLKAPK